MDALQTKFAALQEILRGYGSAAIAFSGGVDSTFLLMAARQTLGDRVLAITADFAFVPRREITEATEFCSAHGIRQLICHEKIFDYPEICENPINRCYICKKILFCHIQSIAAKQGIPIVAEGTNLDDLDDYRPGLQALRELGIQSPLREVSFTKQDIRTLSRSMNLPTAEKPAFACLASRIPYGDAITAEKLRMAECAEQYLQQQGFRQVRVRIHNDIARIEVLPSDFEPMLQRRMEIYDEFRAIGFRYTALDLLGYRTGSLNEA